MTRKIGAVVLAAGGSSRLGEPKQLLMDLHGETLVHRAVRDAIAAGATPVIVVVGAGSAEVTHAVQDFLDSESGIVAVENPNWKTGLSSSIQRGVAVLREMNADVEGLLLLTCDMPSVGSAHLKLLYDVFDAGAERVASTYGNTRGIPAIIPSEEFAELLMLSGDRGAKRLLEMTDTAIVELSGGNFDLDTADDVAKWRAQQRF